MLRKGSTVRDRPTRAIGWVRHVTRIPPGCDLFGDPLPAHRRYIVEFEDGRWANNRTTADLEPVA